MLMSPADLDGISIETFKYPQYFAMPSILNGLLVGGGVKNADAIYAYYVDNFSTEREASIVHFISVKIGERNYLN